MIILIAEFRKNISPKKPYVFPIKVIITKKAFFINSWAKERKLRNEMRKLGACEISSSKVNSLEFYAGSK